MRAMLHGTLAVVFLAALAGVCVAQNQGTPFRRPNVSPYMNLLRPETEGLANYQTLVRPMVNQRRRNLEVARELSALQTAVVENNLRDQRGEAALRPTGHTTGFMNSSHFYGFYYSNYYPTMATRRRR